MARSGYKCGMDGCSTARRGLGGWLNIVAASIALSPLLSGCSSFSSSSASSSGPEPGAASSSPPGSSAAPSASSPSGTSVETLKQPIVGFLKVFRDPEPDEAGAPAKIGVAQPQPGAPSSSSASSSAQQLSAASSSPSGSSAAPSSSSASGTSVESLKQSLVVFLNAFRDLEPGERAPAKIGVAQPLPNTPSSATAAPPAGAPNSSNPVPASPPQRPNAQ